MSSIKEDGYYMDGSIRYIKFSRDYDKFDEWKDKTKEITRHKGILNYIPKEWSCSIPRWDKLPSGHQRYPLKGLNLGYIYWGQKHSSE